MSTKPPSLGHRNQPEASLGLAASRAAAEQWALQPIGQRLKALERWRHALLARERDLLAVSPRPGAELISSELIPLADACRFLERNAKRLLRRQRLGRRGRPRWMMGHSAVVERVPHGAVLIIAPSNYPLFLPGVQMLQALAAGNSVTIKPGQGGAAAAAMLKQISEDARIPPDLVVVLDESAAAGKSALKARFAKVLFTGSAETGRKVLSAAAKNITPATVELSGCDAAIVMPNADLKRAARAIAFGIALNGGHTCISPRRLLVPRADEDRICESLETELADRAAVPLSPATVARLVELAGDAAPVCGGFTESGEFLPAIYRGLPESHPLANADIFAPLAVVLPYDDIGEAAAQVNRCPYALGASVFGSPSEARRIARRLEVGSVCINDLIVPTADPRLPFGGRGESGFGVTRGAEGLLEMTRPRVITRHRGRWQPHLDAPRPADDELLAGYLHAAHGATLAARFGGIRRLMHAARGRRSKNYEKTQL